MKTLGLIGRTLTHSFSKKYFTEKFSRENIKGYSYKLFEIAHISEVQELLKRSELLGLNVTIPYKTEVIPYLNGLAESAKGIGAVNVIARSADGWTGHNSDYYGFLDSLRGWLKDKPSGALVLGTGGASMAVKAVLEDEAIPYRLVSRHPVDKQLSYDQLDSAMIREYQLIINTTPLGMYPKVDGFPELPYSSLTPNHYLYDLVYNPEETGFLRKGKLQGSRTKGGLEMLYLQAEKAWQIWNEE